MPLVDIQVMTGVFDAEQKRRIASRVSEVIHEITGTSQPSWIRVQEVKQDDWTAGAGYMIDAPVQSLLSPYQIMMNRACTEENTAEDLS